jgi:phosphate uptake regulator
MKRKVIQLAGKTLVVSLPSKWAKKYGVKKGEEIEVEQQEGKLIIKAATRGEQSATKTLVVKEVNVMLNRIISGLYKAGYEEIEITYESPEQYRIIRDALNKTCMGYEVIRHGQKTLQIKNLSELHLEEFDNILRRLFLTLLSSADDALEYIKQGNLNGMRDIELRDQMINKYSDLCRRILNIRGLDTTKKTTTYYYICEELEKIGDGYRDLMRFMIKDKITKVNKETIELIMEINRFLRMLYELFYSFDLNKLEAAGEFTEKLNKEFSSCFEAKSVKDLKLNFYLYRIFSMLFDINGSIITANI